MYARYLERKVPNTYHTEVTYIFLVRTWLNSLLRFEIRSLHLTLTPHPRWMDATIPKAGKKATHRIIRSSLRLRRYHYDYHYDD